MTVSNNSMMASQVYANRDVQAKSGASGTWTGGSAPQSSTMNTNKSVSFDKAEFSQLAQELAKNARNNSLQTTQANSSPQTPSPANEMQKNLFNKIMAAYGNSTAGVGTASNLSA